MSIATLKKKSQTLSSSLCVNSKNGFSGFSLNGTHRSQGYIGQTTLSRSLPKTLMQGNTIKGHGGCCGFYTIGPVVNSAVTSTENIYVVKPSVLGYYGMKETKYRWITRPEPYATVKPDTNNNNSMASDYTTTLRNEAIACSTSNNIPTISCCPNNGFTSSSNYNQLNTNGTITKANKYLSEGEYIYNLQSDCSNNKVFPNNTLNMSYGC
jgi:hypothetical protein